MISAAALGSARHEGEAAYRSRPTPAHLSPTLAHLSPTLAHLLRTLAHP